MGRWLTHYQKHVVAYKRVVFPLLWLMNAYILFFIYAYVIQWITETFT